MNPGWSEQSEENELDDAFSFPLQIDHAGLRLDHFLVQMLPSLSRSQIANAIKTGSVLVNGTTVTKASAKLKAEDVISGEIEAPHESEVHAQNIPFEIIYEDDHLLAISKPPNLVVHPGSGNAENTLVNGLVYHCKNISAVGDTLRPGIVHRLDKDTSGVMVVAKTSEMHRLLVEAFKSREVIKKYFALVVGVPKECEGRIVAPLGRHPVNRVKMAVRQSSGRFAASSWRVEKVYPGGYSLLQISIETGRTHQIRVHMAFLGHPVAGDTLYGAGKSASLFPRQMLHSAELRFIHPLNKRKMVLTAPLWPDMEHVLAVLENNTASPCS